jgi:hypothetical protein
MLLRNGLLGGALFSGLLFGGQGEPPAPPQGGGGSYRFIEPYNKPKKKEEQQDASVYVQPVKVKANIGKPSAIGSIRVDAECVVYGNNLASGVGLAITSSTKNLHDEEFAILLAMM